MKWRPNRTWKKQVDKENMKVGLGRIFIANQCGLLALI